MVAEMAQQHERFLKPYVIGVAGSEGSVWHYENEAASHWRDVLLRLSEEMMYASRLRPDLAPILRAALDHAIEILLTHGCEEQLIRLEQWLGDAEATLCGAAEPLDRAALLRMAA